MTKGTSFPTRIKNLPPFEGAFDAFKLTAKDCDILFATYPPGTSIDPHAHDTDNWGVITKGKMFITMDGKETGYGIGDWYHVPSHAVHSARCDEETEEIEFWFRASRDEPT